MDFSRTLKDFSIEYGINLSLKIGNPPKLQSHECFCMWSDLLGFGNMLQLNNWHLNTHQKRKIYDRLKAAHSAVLYYSSFDERNLILNDGIAKVFHLKNRLNKNVNLLHISLYLRSCVELHMSICKTELENNYPGCRSVLAFGESIEYLADEIRLDDWGLNYTKPEGSAVSDFAKQQENPVIIYNPKELQMNTAFSKSFLLENSGSKSGLPGNHLYVDKSIIDAIAKFAKRESYKLVWKETSDELSLFVTKDKTNIDNVIMGFCFDDTMIKPTIDKYKTIVYRLKKFYPHDEKPIEFCFDLDKFSDYNV